MTITQVYDRNKLLKLAAWAQMSPAPQKKAFVDPASAAAMPPGAPPMDPAMGDPMMAGGMPTDPAAVGGMPPMGAGMPAGEPMPIAAPGAAAPLPVDPSAQAMGDQEMMRSIIRDEIQKAMGGGEGGVAAGGKKSGNKFEDALRVLEDKMKEQSKIFVAALRNAGIEIPLADLYGIDKADGSGAAAGTPTTAQAQPGISETLQTGLGGDAAGSQPGKIASLGREEEQIAQLTKLAQTKDSLKRSALAERMTPFDPNEADLSYLAGLFR